MDVGAPMPKPGMAALPQASSGLAASSAHLTCHGQVTGDIALHVVTWVPGQHHLLHLAPGPGLAQDRDRLTRLQAGLAVAPSLATRCADRKLPPPSSQSSLGVPVAGRWTVSKACAAVCRSSSVMRSGSCSRVAAKAAPERRLSPAGSAPVQLVRSSKTVRISQRAPRGTTRISPVSSLMWNSRDCSSSSRTRLLSPVVSTRARYQTQGTDCRGEMSVPSMGSTTPLTRTSPAAMPSRLEVATEEMSRSRR